MFGSNFFGTGFFGSNYWGEQPTGIEYLYLEIHFNGTGVQQVALVRSTTYNYTQAMNPYYTDNITFRA